MTVSILDLIPEPTPVPTGRGNLMVRGLTLEETVALLRNHAEVIASFFGEGEPDFDAMLYQAPGLVATIIAWAADARDQETAVARLPISVQLAALSAIWKASVPDLKKLSELVAEIASGRLQSPSPSTNG